MNEIKIIFDVIKDISLEIASILKNRNVEYSNHANASGDDQLKIDLVANEKFSAAFRKLNIAGFISEEIENIEFNKKIDFDFENLCMRGAKSKIESNNIESGKIESNIIKADDEIFIAFDPLDGSSLIDSNLTIGSIFGVYKNALQGANLIASSYVLYGPRLEFVMALGGKTSHFIYNYDKCEWQFVQDFVLNEKGKINAPGATQKDWTSHHRDYVNYFFSHGYRLRYSGGMVADLHQILCKKGGIFSYPATLVDSKNLNKGKLRNLFEVLPFALIFENANGFALDCKNRLLDIKTTKLHDTTPCFFGSKYEIEKLKDFYK